MTLNCLESNRRTIIEAVSKAPVALLLGPDWTLLWLQANLTRMLQVMKNTAF